LYAIHSDAATRRVLGVEAADPALPLYVGKAQDSLFERVVGRHFATGKTGTSTIRRTLAALLRDDLSLEARPRNPRNPADFSMYGLEPGGDARLTEWMRGNLVVACWAYDRSRPLGNIEDDVLDRWQPPLNIDGVHHRWVAAVKAKRKLMADEARSWAEANTSIAPGAGVGGGRSRRLDVRPPVCPGCGIELPKTGQCDYCA
jgi:hypothetical protein